MCRYYLYSKLLRSGVSRHIGTGGSRGEAFEEARFSIVIQNTRHPKMQNTAIRFAKRYVMRSFESLALQPEFRILWNVSICQCIAYQLSFCSASSRE
jgi:hypothetical protein